MQVEPNTIKKSTNSVQGTSTPGKKVKLAEQKINDEIFGFTCAKEKKKCPIEKQALWNQCNGKECERWVCEKCIVQTEIINK